MCIIQRVEYAGDGVAVPGEGKGGAEGEGEGGSPGEERAQLPPLGLPAEQAHPSLSEIANSPLGHQVL